MSADTTTFPFPNLPLELQLKTLEHALTERITQISEDLSFIDPSDVRDLSKVDKAFRLLVKKALETQAVSSMILMPEVGLSLLEWKSNRRLKRGEESFLGAALSSPTAKSACSRQIGSRDTLFIPVYTANSYDEWYHPNSFRYSTLNATLHWKTHDPSFCPNLQDFVFTKLEPNLPKRSIDRPALNIHMIQQALVDLADSQATPNFEGEKSARFFYDESLSDMSMLQAELKPLMIPYAAATTIT